VLKRSFSFNEETTETILRIFQRLNIPLVKIDDLNSDKFVEFIAKLDRSLNLYSNSLPSNSPSGEQKPVVNSDVSTTEPSLEERAKTNPALKEWLENVNKPLPPPPCPFCSKGYTDEKTKLQFVYCDHVTKRHPKSGFIPFQACLKCWERKEYIKKHRAETPPQIKKVYCTFGGSWIDPSLCLECKENYYAKYDTCQKNRLKEGVVDA
jgi:hypothetical protein